MTRKCVLRIKHLVLASAALGLVATAVHAAEQTAAPAPAAQSAAAALGHPLPLVSPYSKRGTRSNRLFRMTDYRQPLYQHYVSKFKRSECSAQLAAEGSAWRYFDQKYFRHIQHLRLDDAILDVGCGSGLLLAYLVQKGFRCAEGVDISEEQIELAKARSLQVRCGDVFSLLEGRAEAFEAVIALDLVEHFTKEEALSLFALLFRALKPGGILLVQTPNGQGLFAGQVIYGDLTHCTIFTPESLSQALRLTGFEDIRFDETGPVPGSWKGRLRLLLWNSIKRVANCIRLVETGRRQDIWTETVICVCRKPASSGGGAVGLLGSGGG